MLAAALVLVAAGIAAVRLGWGGRRGAAAVGWGLVVLGLAAAVRAAGAWGVASAALVGMAAALVAVAVAGCRSPAHHRRAPRCAAAPVERPRGRLLRRMAVFVLTVPVSLAAAQALALAARRFAGGHGAGTADATVLALLTMPVAWTVLMTVQLTRESPARMIAAPLATGGLAAVLAWTA